MFALLLFSSAGLFDEKNTPFHLLSVSAPGAVGHAIRGLDGWDGMDEWVDASVLIQHTISPQLVSPHTFRQCSRQAGSPVGDNVFDRTYKSLSNMLCVEFAQTEIF